MKEPIKLVLGDWTDFPGLRWPEEQAFSGEEYRKEFVRPAFDKAKAEGREVHVYFNGIEGVNSSFISEAFAGLHSRENVPKEDIQRVFKFFSDKSSIYVKTAVRRIEEAVYEPNPNRDSVSMV